MEKAVKRIFQAIDNDERIIIYGDYDCDGIPGSTILHDFFKKVGYKKFANYIPHRHNEGYGLQLDAVKQFVEDGITLIVTVDVGITDITSVKHAQDNGVDVIVTDHHLPIVEKGTEVLPEAYVILNSKQKDDSYPDDMLCGAGVAFKLVQALLSKGKEEGRFGHVVEGWEKWLLDMAGLSTIADMVPLQNENRVLAHYGLTVMRKSNRKGLLRLLQGVRINQKNVTEDDVGFMIAPRINAASRMDHPLAAFELLAAEDDATAEEQAKHLESLNDKRKGYVASMIKSARKKLDARELGSVIVIGDTQWLPGVLGLAANKLVEEYGRPVYVWGHDESGVIKGSCRTDGSASVIDIMRAAPEGTFEQFGGHDASGGFTVKRASLHTLEEVLSTVYDSLDKNDVGEEEVDAELTLDDVHWNTYNDIAKLAPFGMGNKKPLFFFKAIAPTEVKLFGKGKEHLGLDFRTSNGRKISSIGFFMTPGSFPDVEIEAGRPLHLVAAMEKSFFRYQPELRLRIVAIHPAVK
jgi:single-stranded-DNA-specific exonuclease